MLFQFSTLKIFKKDLFATYGASESAQQQELSEIGLINCW